MSDEETILQDLRGRLTGIGAQQYGALDIKTDARDFLQQANEELLDGMFYGAIWIRKVRAALASRPELAKALEEAMREEATADDPVPYVPVAPRVWLLKSGSEYWSVAGWTKSQRMAFKFTVRPKLSRAHRVVCRVIRLVPRGTIERKRNAVAAGSPETRRKR